MEAETYGVDPNVQVVPPNLVLPIKVTIQTSALEIGAFPRTFENVVNNFYTL